MDRDDAVRVLTEHATARDDLLARVREEATANGRTLWQVGSGGTGTGDAWSDLDLLATPGFAHPQEPALITDHPANGPRGGGYTGAAYLAGPLLVWIDWYTWPAELAAPAEAVLLAGEGKRGELDLGGTLDAHGRGEQAATDPAVFTLAMLPIAAKYVARGRRADAAGMIGMLGGEVATEPGAEPLADLVAELRRLLSAVDGGPREVAERVGRVIDVAEALVG